MAQGSGHPEQEANPLQDTHTVAYEELSNNV